MLCVFVLLCETHGPIFSSKLMQDKPTQTHTHVMALTH